MESTLQSVQEHYDCIRERHHFPPSLKPQQAEALLNLVNGKSTIAILPTGFGKSIIYTALPLIMDSIFQTSHVAIVISPLKALMKEQVMKCESQGIPAVAAMEECRNEALACFRSAAPLSVLYISPEQAVTEDWQNTFFSTERSACVVAIDEAHCIDMWGEEFRTKYGELICMRAAFPKAPILLCSATMTPSLLKNTCDNLGIQQDSFELINLPPDRPGMDYEEDLQWVAEHMRTSGVNSKKIIIYCRRISETGPMFEWLVDAVGIAAFNGEKKPQNRIIEQFHSLSTTTATDRILKEFPQKGSNIRCVISTVAFGMGIDIPDVDVVIHWGLSSSILCYWQEVGRCGRDGRPCCAYLYAYRKSLGAEIEHTFSSLCKGLNCGEVLCLRQAILQHFQLKDEALSPVELCDRNCTKCQCQMCQCCSPCRDRCPCVKN